MMGVCWRTNLFTFPHRAHRRRHRLSTRWGYHEGAEGWGWRPCSPPQRGHRAQRQPDRRRAWRACRPRGWQRRGKTYLVGAVQDLIVEHRVVESKTQNDGAGGSETILLTLFHGLLVTRGWAGQREAYEFLAPVVAASPSGPVWNSAR